MFPKCRLNKRIKRRSVKAFQGRVHKVEWANSGKGLPGPVEVF